MVREEKIQIHFVNLLSQIYLKIINDNKQDLEEIVLKLLEIEFKDIPLEIIENDKKNLNHPIYLVSKKIIKETNRPEFLFSIIEDVKKFIEDYPNNSLDTKNQQLQKIASNLGDVIFPNDPQYQNLIESINKLILGEIDKIGPGLVSLLSIDKKSLKIVKTLLEDLNNVVQAPQNFVDQKIQYYTVAAKDDKFGDLNDIKEKMKNKELDTKELFSVFDVDKSGKISLEEFKLLTKRLNMNLSEHRIREIFTSVKGDESSYNQELNEKEFELAFSYLQEKSIMLTLEFLGITKEILFGILIWLTFLLLVLFAFIFAGIAAFTIAGTFGSIINSMFPIGYF